ncbi:hypothetical protein RFI_11972 [Reticulomyxa filosa]|uniref:Uncharacterized protein n=1 Tax=Reticulomyxa filosa TaxID=46433 RepID=X6NIJ5_RETFI|nr:hypothetical protein RFI_11972 [Reticulomyxa filosa]|eukprot:ETO25172.1 hypothetical protein RFI_11972 [Reticulomyxa filosa]
MKRKGIASGDRWCQPQHVTSYEIEIPALRCCILDNRHLIAISPKWGERLVIYKIRYKLSEESTEKANKTPSLMLEAWKVSLNGNFSDVALTPNKRYIVGMHYAYIGSTWKSVELFNYANIINEFDYSSCSVDFDLHFDMNELKIPSNITYFRSFTEHRSFPIAEFQESSRNSDQHKVVQKLCFCDNSHLLISCGTNNKKIFQSKICCCCFLTHVQTYMQTCIHFALIKKKKKKKRLFSNIKFCL